MKHRQYSDEFKKQVIEEYLNGVGRNVLLRQYDLHLSVFRRWKRKYIEFGSFPDGRGKGSKGRPRTIDISQMSKDEYIKYLEMENNILKQLCSLNNSQAR